MPAFSGEEGTREEVALFRALQGCGALRSGFLDLAIALEAALLGGTTTELAYKFRLYGALYISDGTPQAAFDEFKEVYTVRSNLVHGTPVTRERHHAADLLARRLTIAVLKKAIEMGWPEPSTLDRLALAVDPGTAR